MSGWRLGRAAATLLWPAARAWSLSARARARLYRSGRLAQQRLERPVVSIGNLSAGGTGKTPFVIWLFSELARRGLRPAVLTRGYRRRDGSQPLLLTSPGSTPGAEGAGDEAQLMLQHGLAPIGVGADRFRAGAALEAQCAVDLHLLDDGFQHLALARDLDIVLLDSSRLPWEDDLLPAGRLREPPSALRRAAVIVLTRIQDWTAIQAMKTQVRRSAPQADIYAARTRLAGPPAPPVSGPVLAFAGLGNPRAFFADLCVAGVRVVGTRHFSDHHRYTLRDLLRLERCAREVHAQALVTTEKDAANLPQTYRNGLEMPLRVVGMKLEVERGGELVDRVEKLVRK